jgi:tetratricopeptide (TPR) repeat protein
MPSHSRTSAFVDDPSSTDNTHSQSVRPPQGSHRSKIPDSFLRRLRDDLVHRRTDRGFARLRSHIFLINECHPRTKNATFFLSQLAQWADIGFGQTSQIRELLARFAKVSREELPLRDYIHLQIAGGFSDIRERNHANAIKRLEHVLSIEDEVRDKELIVIANFWIGRCHRQEDRYEHALRYVIRAKEVAVQLKYYELAATAQVEEAWVLFLLGKGNEATTVLDLAEKVLNKTDDYVARGAVNSAHGTIAYHEGKYNEALGRLTKATEEYGRRDPWHGGIAICLIFMASVKRLLAAKLRDRLDAEAARTRTSHADGEERRALDKGATRQQLKALRAEAFEYLHRAKGICRNNHDSQGFGDALWVEGFLHLDNGDLDLASSKAVDMCQLDHASNLKIKARARILQSAIECAKCEEQIVERHSTEQTSQLAREYAEEALECAKLTLSRRLMAQAFIALGSALALDPVGDLDDARRACGQAEALLESDAHDYVWRDLQVLDRKLREAGGIEPILREWSQGLVGKKTFQEITQDFAAIVIPKVWRREGGKISRVAARLSMSPKKVRRLLRRQGIVCDEEPKRAQPPK